jgi:hypothetical protein
MGTALRARRGSAYTRPGPADMQRPRTRGFAFQAAFKKSFPFFKKYIKKIKYFIYKITKRFNGSYFACKNM